MGCNGMGFFVTYLCVIAGGAAGALSRFGVQEACRKWTSLPGWGAIFIANMLGCLILGFAVAWLQALHGEIDLEHPSALRLYMETQSTNHGIALLATGFSGAFTTFSTFSLDNIFLYHTQKRAQMAFNMVVSVGFGFVAAAAGWYLGHALEI